MILALSLFLPSLVQAGGSVNDTGDRNWTVFDTYGGGFANDSSNFNWTVLGGQGGGIVNDSNGANWTVFGYFAPTEFGKTEGNTPPTGGTFGGAGSPVTYSADNNQSKPYLPPSLLPQALVGFNITAFLQRTGLDLTNTEDFAVIAAFLGVGFLAMLLFVNSKRKQREFY